MKIAIADNNGLKFTNDLKEHWEKQGHEVRFERGASEYLAQWADIYFIDTWDHNIHYLFDLYHGKQEIAKDLKWDNSKKPRVIVRALDWEIWLGLARSQEMIDWVDKIVFIAPHIQRKVENEVNLKDKGILIRPGVNMAKFAPKTTQTDGFALGMVLGDMWWPKNHMAGLDIFTQLYRKDSRWRLHIRGQHEPGEYWKVMYEHYLDSRGIRDAVKLYEFVTDMNEFYEQIDILLHPGMKEAFCYAVGEAMSKGIPVVVNEFYGSREIWPEWVLYQTHNEAISLILNPKKGEVYREFIKNNYDLKKMLMEFDKLL